MKKSVYCDFAAATPVDPEVVAAMEPYGHDIFANPSAAHTPGRRARRAVDEARAVIAEILHCAPQEVVFTSGGTESINLALLGSVRIGTNDEVVTSSIEHEAVLEVVKYFCTHGHACHVVSPRRNGIVDAQEIVKKINAHTRIVSVMMANNEIGTIQDVAAISQCVKEKNPDVLVHTDACQAAPFLPLFPTEMNIDLCSISASKMYGPKGIGALVLRRGVVIEPQLRGGGQERGLRSGTEPVTLIVGFAKAFALSVERREKDVQRMTKLRDRLIDGLIACVPGVRVNGNRKCRLPNYVNMFFPDIDGELLLAHLDSMGVYASLGSACAAGALDPSHVLLGIGYSKKEARQCVRFTLGRTTTEQEIDTVLELLPRAIGRSM